MSESKQTSTEVFESLTGFEEQAIVEHFGRNIGDLASVDESMWNRALIFTVKRREGLADVDAHQAAMSLSLLDNISFFSGADEESGKDESPEPQPEEQPVSSLSSVS